MNSGYIRAVAKLIYLFLFIFEEICPNSSFFHILVRNRKYVNLIEKYFMSEKNSSKNDSFVVPEQKHN